MRVGPATHARQLGHYAMTAAPFQMHQPLEAFGEAVTDRRIRQVNTRYDVR